MNEQKPHSESERSHYGTKTPAGTVYRKPRLRAFGKIESVTLGPSPAGNFDSPPTSYFVSGPG